MSFLRYGQKTVKKRWFDEKDHGMVEGKVDFFEEKHTKLAKWIYQIFYFFVFSMRVTIFQYHIFTFMPGILGKEMAGTKFMWLRHFIIC